MPLEPTPQHDATADPSDRYRVEHRIGAGATGEVHVALDQQLGRRVALKVLDRRLVASERSRRRFHREADVLARLDSAHIVQVYDHGDRSGVPWIATQLVSGGDLQRLLAVRGPMPPHVAVQVCAQIADALAVAHGAGIVHGDVKPSNVLVHDPDAAVPHVYLCDFGVASEMVEADGASAAAPTVVGGTHAYLAPERARGERPSAASDTYAVGCLLWECLTGRPPFVGTDVAVLLAHAEQPPPRLGRADPASAALDALVARTLDKDPGRRHADAAVLAADLRRAVAADVGPGASLPVDPGRTTPVRRRRGLVAAGAAGALVLAAGVGVAVVLGGDDEAPAGASGGAGDDGPGTSSLAEGPVAGDLDGDGLGDLALTHQFATDQATRLLRSTGSGFGDPEDFVAGASMVMSGDVDGDGSADIVAVGGGPDTFQVSVVFGGEGDDLLVDLDAPSGASSLNPVVGDFDGDGLADVAVTTLRGDGGGQQIWVALAEEDGFGELEQWYSGDHDTAELVPGDFDGDGRADVLVNDLPNQTFRLLRSEGDRFEADVLRDGGVQQLAQQVRTPGVGDVDGDGADELVQIGGSGSDLLVVWALEDDVLVDSTWLRLEDVDRADQPPPSAPVVVDVDGDGFADVVRVLGAADEPPQQVVVMRSSGEDLEDPVEWARYDCGCDGFVAPVGPMRTA